MNTFAPPKSDTTAKDRPQRRALLAFCLFFYAISIVHGVRSAVVVSSTALTDLVVPVALAICLCSWALADARERQSPIPQSLQIWFYGFAPIVVPGYILGTRGWRGLAWMLLHVVAWFALATVVMNMVGYAYWGNAWWQPFQVE
jgi:hypothetical protein